MKHDEVIEAAAQALRDAAHDCDGACGLSFSDCYDAHPVTWSARVAGETHVDGEVRQLAATVLNAIWPLTYKHWFTRVFGTAEELRAGEEAARDLPDESKAIARSIVGEEIEAEVRAKIAAGIQELLDGVEAGIKSIRELGSPPSPEMAYFASGLARSLSIARGEA